MRQIQWVAVAAVFVVCLTVVDRCHRNTVSEYEARVERLTEQVEQEKKVAEAAKAEAAAERAKADSLAVAAARRTAAIDERIEQVRDSTPDHLRSEPAVVVRDSIITELRTVVDTWRTAFEHKQREAAALETALRATESSRDSLVAVLKDRPGERPWYVPRLGVGPFVGWCADNTPCAGPVAVTLTWEIRF